MKRQMFMLKNDNQLIYKIAYHEECGSSTICYRYSLELIAGYDYINPDQNDEQGYVVANRFVEDVQTESVLAYPLQETLTKSIEENGFTIIDKLPTIYNLV